MSIATCLTFTNKCVNLYMRLGILDPKSLQLTSLSHFLNECFYRSIKMTEEIWRDIDGWIGLYQISNLGRVRSLDGFQFHEEGGLMKKMGQILKCNKQPAGYSQCLFNRFGRKKTNLVHRLVAKAFPEICGEWFDGCVVDHIDTIRDNNRAENLRVCTHHENNMNPITRQRYHDMQIGKKKNYPVWNKGKKLPHLSGEKSSRSRPILQYTKDGESVKRWANTSIAGDTLGIARTSITNCLTGLSNTAKGFVWKYESEVKNVN